MADTESAPNAIVRAERGTVQSVARAAELLRCFAYGGTSFRLTDFVKMTNLNASTVHRLLKTLIEAGLITQNGSNESYEPGTGLIDIARALLPERSRDEIRGVLETLMARTGESVSIGVRRNDVAAVLISVPSSNGLRHNREPGDSIPLTTTALGKALLVFGPDSTSETDTNTETAMTATQRQHETSRRLGYTTARDEEVPGVVTVAVPITSITHGTMLAALEVSAPSIRLTDDDLIRIARELQIAAGALDLSPLLCHPGANTDGANSIDLSLTQRNI